MDERKPIPEENRLKPVVKGTVVGSSNKSLWKKIVETFAYNNIKDARDYIIADVIVPGILDILYEGITRGAGKLIYGEKGAPKSRKRSGIDYSTGIRRLSDGEVFKSVQIKREQNSAIEDVYDYNELLLKTKCDAEILLDSMCEYLDSHDVITVAKMYDLADYPGGTWTDSNWGWASLAGARIIRDSDGWILQLPKVQSIKEIR